MSPTWQSDDQPVIAKPTPAGWLRIGGRGIPLVVVICGGLVILLTLRLIEKPLCGLRRPVTPWVTQAVCRATLWLIGIGYRTHGQLLRGAGAVVANHASWLDIFALNAGQRVTFVAKSEVARWPGIGWLARAAGTLFIRRDRGQAKAQIDLFRDSLVAGHQLLFFPEGTSTDGLQVLPFKPTLFAAFLDPAMVEGLKLQPVSVTYVAPPGADLRFYGWWGTMNFGPHLLAVLAQRPQGAVTVTYHPPVLAADYPDRKTLALVTETQVRAGVTGQVG